MHKQIVCISTHYWDDPWFRKQHFMSRFLQNEYKIAYIEPTFSMIRKPEKAKKQYAINRFLKIDIEKREKNLFIIKPPRSIPFWSNPFISKINYIYFTIRIKFVLKKIGFSNYILWIYRPEYAYGINLLNYKTLVFDICDDLAAYDKNIRRCSHIKKCIIKIIKKSDLIIVTASTLFKKYKQFAKNNNIFLIPNGYDSKLFNNSISGIPKDLNVIRHPIIGFIGTLFSFLDYELLKYIIQKNPDKSFVFIGSCQKNCFGVWQNIIKYSNVFWLGKKKKEEIPLYVSNFDICINPFKIDGLSKSVSPLKVFEYLAMKKPVISVSMESLEKEQIATYINFCSTYEDFNNKLNGLLKNGNDYLNKLDDKKINYYSWDKLFLKVQESVNSLSN